MLGTSWLNGDYILKDAPLQEFARIMEQLFDLHVRFADERLATLYIAMQINRKNKPMDILQHWS